MAITGRIIGVPDRSQKIMMIKLFREVIQFHEIDPGTGRERVLGLKEAKETMDQVFAGGCEFTFPNKDSLELAIAKGFVIEGVQGLVDPKDEQTLVTVRALLQDAMDSDDIEAFEALEVAYKMFQRRVKGNTVKKS